MRRAYIKRVHGFSPDFIKDIYDTTVRIHKKDGKAYPLRVFKSVSKRWGSVYRYKITLTLNYLEYLGLLEKRLEDVEEYKRRMARHSGLFQRGIRRAYFSPSVHNTIGNIVEYRKVTHKELGLPTKIEDYPV